MGELRELGAIRSDRVAKAFGVVQRHLFAPEASLDTVYAATQAVVTKRDANGAALSAVSESHIQAVMLEQAQLEPGLRVLEVGSGGYNAALIAELVGTSGSVTTVDIDPDVVERTRNCLSSAGYDQVRAVLGDAEGGVPEHAPYDRVIVTVEAWDVPPAWVDQLAPAGLIVVPLRFRGLTRSIVLKPDGDRLVSKGYLLCGFVPMQGAGSHAKHQTSLDGDRVVLSFDDERTVDASGLRDALGTARVERWSGVEVGGMEPFDDLDLWVATVADDFGILTATQDAVDGGLVTAPARSGAKTIVSGRSLAYRTAARPVDAERTRFEFGVYAHGPDAGRLADTYVELIRAWEQNYRAGPGAHIEVLAAGTPTGALPAGRVVDKNHTRVVVSWPDGPERRERSR